MDTTLSKRRKRTYTKQINQSINNYSKTDLYSKFPALNATHRSIFNCTMLQMYYTQYLYVYTPYCTHKSQTTLRNDFTLRLLRDKRRKRRLVSTSSKETSIYSTPQPVSPNSRVWRSKPCSTNVRVWFSRGLSRRSKGNVPETVRSMPFNNFDIEYQNVDNYVSQTNYVNGILSASTQAQTVTHE